MIKSPVGHLKLNLCDASCSILKERTTMESSWASSWPKPERKHQGVFTTNWSAATKSPASHLPLDNKLFFSGRALLCLTWGLCSFCCVNSQECRMTTRNRTLWCGCRWGSDDGWKSGIFSIIINSFIIMHDLFNSLHPRTYFQCQINSAFWEPDRLIFLLFPTQGQKRSSHTSSH